MANVEELLERDHRLAFERSKLIEDLKFRRDYKESFKDKPTRLAVIGKNSEILYSNHNCEFELSWQDEGRTLKVFIK